MSDKKPPKPKPTRPYPGLVSISKKDKTPERKSPGTTIRESDAKKKRK